MMQLLSTAWWTVPALLICGVLIALVLSLTGRKSSSMSGASRKLTSNMRRMSSAIGPGGTHPNGPVDIYFGSQTGTAEGFAKALGKECPKHGFEGRVMDLEEFEPDRLQSSNLAVFLLATYGEGDPTDNAIQFHKWLADKDGALTNQALGGLRFAVFGLGSTQYEHFNQMGKVADKRLTELGADRLLDIALGDDAGGSLEEEFEAWKEDLWPVFNDAVASMGRMDSVSITQVSSDLNLPELDFTLSYLPKGRMHTMRSFDDSKINASTKFYFHHHIVRVAVNRELRTPKDGGSTKHIELDIENTGLKYNTADNLAVLPENDATVVAAVAKALNYDLDAVFDIHSHKAAFPTPCTVREALSLYFDLKGIPRRNVLADLAVYATDADERQRLKRMSSKQGRDEYQEFVVKQGRSLSELITETFPSLQIPLEDFVSQVPHLQPRYYTISSSSLVYPNSIHATVAVTETKLPSGRVHKGLCSSYLASLPVGSKVRIFVRPSSFRLPASPSTPVILVGPGTGIAPMRALLQERRYQRVVEGKPVGPTHMFFGCRRRDTDFLYEDELTQYAADGTLSHLHLAFSRETTAKVYVQHLITKQDIAKGLWTMVDTGSAHIYVCGGTTMGHDVQSAFVQVAVHGGKKSVDRASTLVKDMMKNQRYIQELWSA